MHDPFDLCEPSPAPLNEASLAQGAPSRLAHLNPAQRQAVETTEGPVLVLAGAGTGKTRVLTTRLAHILLEGKAQPWQVLAVTFTNRAASEMRERVTAMIGGAAEGMWIGTFHAQAARILRENAAEVGLRSNFSILDADDQLRLLKQFYQSENIDEKTWPARAMMGVIQRWKDRALPPERVTMEEGADYAEGLAIKLYGLYQARLRELNACDFGDLLLFNVTLMSSHPEVARRYQQRFRYILVDEYQDTNIAQYLWLRLLALGHHNLCCVGDDDQSIYSWRGAEIGNILRFEEDYAEASIIRLERNYRSSGHILAAASGLISHNQGRLGKTLWTEDELGHKVSVLGVWDGEQEARLVCEEIAAQHSKGRSLSAMAVLVRTGFQMREFEERLITLGVPYRVVGGPRFYERREIRDAVAYLRVVVQPDDDLAWERIINTPKRGIGDATLQPLHQLARSARLSLFRAIEQLLGTDEIKPRARAALGQLLEDFANWRRLAETLTPSELAARVLKESGYLDMWRLDRSPEAPGRIENLNELVGALGEFDSLGEFLEHVSLVMENQENLDHEKVSLMTLHAAKGLEFDLVFLPGWEEELFPHRRSLDENGLQGLEEERRLAYVGLTRARQRAVVSYAASRRIYNQWQNTMPSRFIDELPDEHVELDRNAGALRTARSGMTAGWQTGPRGAAVGGGSGGGGSLRDSRVVQALINDRGSAGKSAKYRQGDRVFHRKFGYGLVQTVDGEKLEVHFDKAGAKKVVDSFVSRADGNA